MTDSSTKSGDAKTDDLESLKVKLEGLESLRTRQNTIKGVGLAIIVALFSYILFSLYSTYTNFESEEFAGELEVELKKTFEPRVKELVSRGQTDLLPLARESVSKSLESRLPQFEGRFKKIAIKAAKTMETSLEASLADMVVDIEESVLKELGDESFSIIFDNDQFQEIIAEEMVAQLDGAEDIAHRFRLELEVIKERNPDFMKQSTEAAEKAMVTSILDLMKYEVDPALGEAKGVE